MLAVQEQLPAVMVMVALDVVPAAPTEALLTGSDAEHPAAWFTVNVLPAMVMFPLRAGPVFAAKVKLTFPDPVPLAVTPVIHETASEVVHGHAPLDMTSPTEDEPAAAPTLALLLARFPVQPDAWLSVKDAPPALMVPERAGPVLAVKL